MSPFASRPGSWWRALVLALCVLVTAPAAFAQSDTTAPTVTGIALTSDPPFDHLEYLVYRAGSEVDFTLSFSEAVRVVVGQSAPELALRVGNEHRAASYLSGTGTTQMVFRYVVAEGDLGGVSLVTSPLRNAGSITDLAGNPLSGQVPAQLSGTVATVDGVRPTVQVQLTPVPGEARQYDLRITFSERVDGFGADDVTLTSGALLGEDPLGDHVSGSPTVYAARLDVGACFAGEFRVTVRSLTETGFLAWWDAGAANGPGTTGTAGLAAVQVEASPPPMTLSASRTVLDEMYGGSAATGTTVISVAVTGRGIAEICWIGLDFGAPLTSGATYGQDYYWRAPEVGATARAVPVVFGEGDTTATGTVELTVLGDYLTEGEEEFTVEMGYVWTRPRDDVNAEFVTPADSGQLPFSIRDHAPPGITVEVTPEQVLEWDPARGGQGIDSTLTFTVTLEHAVATALTIRMNTDPTAGTATRGVDYQISNQVGVLPGAFDLTMPARRSSAEWTVQLRTTHDELREGDETVVFTAQLLEGGRTVPGGIDSVPTLTLSDPAPSFTFNATVDGAAVRSGRFYNAEEEAIVTYFFVDEGAEVIVTPTNLRYFGDSILWTWAELHDDPVPLLGAWTVNDATGAITFTAPRRSVGYLLRLTVTAFEEGSAVSSRTAFVVVGGGGYLGICGRTSQVRTAIINKLSAAVRAELPATNPCAGVTRAHLAGITGDLNLSYQNLGQLQPYDFAGLTSLTGLDLSNNVLRTLPEGIFDGLTSIEAIVLSSNIIAQLREDAFEGLSSLQRLFLDINCMPRTGLPRGVFEGLTSLNLLALETNGGEFCPSGTPQTLTTFEFRAELVLVGDDEDTLALEVPEGALQEIVASIEVDGGSRTLTLEKGQVRTTIVEDVPLSAPVEVDLTGASITPASGNTFTGFTMRLVGKTQMVPPAPSVITLSSSLPEVFEDESQMPLTLVVELDHRALNDMNITLTVDTSVTDAASDPADYTLTPALAPLTIARGERFATSTLNLAIRHDNANEGDEVIAFSASHPDIAAPGVATLTIRDDDDGVVTVNPGIGVSGTSPAFTANENTVISLTAVATNFAGPITAWRWTQNADDPVQVILAGTASTSAVLLLGLPGRTESYDLRLQVAASHDPGGGLPVETTALDITVAVSADDDAPVVTAEARVSGQLVGGVAISAEVGARVFLLATATDSDEDQELTLAWTGDLPLDSVSDTGANAAFTAPDTEQVLTFTFSADDDGAGAGDDPVTSEVVVTVVPRVNVAAVSGATASAFTPDYFFASEDTSVTFTASETGFATAPGGFVWTQHAFDQVRVLDGVDTGGGRLTLDLPNRSARYVVRLIATAADAPGGTPLTPTRSRTVTVSVAADDAPPVIDEVEASSDGIAAGETITVSVGARVMLRGVASDEDVDQTTIVEWSGIPGLPLTRVTPLDPGTVSFDALAPPGRYTFTFTAYGGLAHLPVRDEVVVEVVESLPVLTITAATSSVPEGGNATFVVTADPVPAGILFVSITVSGAADFLARGEAGERSEILFAGRNMMTLDLATVDDGTAETSAPVTATLGIGAGYRLGSQSTATVTIEDDDMAPEAFTVSVSGGAGLTEKSGVSPGQAFTADEGLATALTATSTGLAMPLVWRWSQSAGDEVQALGGVTAIDEASLSFTLPSWHEDYEISLTLMVTDAKGRSHSLPVRIEVTNANGICDRTMAVQAAILARIAGVDDCNAVTATQLSGIDGELDLSVGGGGTALTALLPQDFAGLAALQRLRLGGNSLSSLPSNIFGELTALTLLDLGGNDFSSLPSGFFAQLASLSHLDLSDNALTAFPAGLSRELSNLETLDLSGNRLDMLSADALNGLDNLESLSLADNRLAQLPAGLFDPVANLVDFNASGNELQSLPQGLFAGLALRYLNLDANRFTALPSGVFTDLGGAGLRIASFADNPKATPSALALTVTMEEARDERGVVLRVAEGAPAVIVFTLEVEGRQETVTMPFGADEVMHPVSAPAGAAVTLGGQLEWQLPDPTMVSMEAPAAEYGHDQTQWAVRGIESAAPALTVTLGEGNEVSIAAASSSVVAGENAMFTLMATEPPEIALTITVELSGDAAAGVAGGSREVVLAPGADRATLTVPTTSTGMGALVATVSDTASYRAGLPSAAVVTVESGTAAAMVAMSIATGEPSVREGGEMILTVMADAAPGEAVTVTVDVAGAALAEDVRAHEVEIGNSAMGTFTVRARANDTVYQGNDTIIATIGDGTGYQPGLPAGAVVTVWDDEKPPSGVGLSVSPEEVTEGDGTVTVTVTATLEGGHPFADPTTVEVMPSASGRMELSTQPPTLSIEIPAGARSATETFELTTPSDDGSWQGDGLVTVSGTHESLPVSGAMVRVRDAFVESVMVRAGGSLVPEEATSPGVLRFSAEEGDTAALRAVLTGASGPDVSHAWSQAADDEVQVLAFGVTTDAAELRFTLPDRTRAYTLNLTLTTTHMPAGGFVPTSVTREVSIEVSADDDAPVISWAGASAPGVPGGEAITVSAGAEVRLLGIATDADADQSLRVAWRGPTGIALAPVGGAPANVTFTAPDVAGMYTFTFEVDDDGAGGDAPVTSEVEVRVVFDVSIAATPASLTEGTSVTLSLTAHRTPTAPFPAIVSLSGGGAFGIADRNRQVTFGAGVSTFEFVLPTDNDDVGEVNATLTARVADSEMSRPGTPASARVMIADDDVRVSIAATQSTVEEGTAASFELTAHGTVATAFTVNVNVSGAETFGVTARVETVSFEPGETTAPLNIATTPDEDDEPDGTITATVESGPGYGPGTPASASMTVSDNDLGVSIEAVSEWVTEDAPVEFVVRADESPATDLNVAVSLAGGGDFGIADGPVTPSPTIEAGSFSATFSLTPNDDNMIEPARVLTATVTSGTGYQAGSPDSATVTLADNDILVGVFAQDDEVNEGSPANFVVSANVAPTEDLTVTLSLSGGADFAVEDGLRTVVIRARRTSATLSVDTFNDELNDEDATLTVRVEPGPGYRVDVPKEDDVELMDDDVVVSISRAAEILVEGESLVLSIDLGEEVSRTFTLNMEYSGALGFLRPGASTRARVEILPGSRLRTLSLQMDDDALDEPGGTFTVTLVEGVGYVVGAQNEVRQTVLDNDIGVSIEAADAPVLEGGIARFTVRVDEGTTLTSPLTVTVGLTRRDWIDGRLQEGPSLYRYPVISAYPNTRPVVVPASTPDNREDGDPVFYYRARVVSVAGSAAVPVPGSDSVDVEIRDNDLDISIEPVASTVTEGESAQFLLTASEVATTPLTVAVNLSVGAGDDFGVRAGPLPPVIIGAGATVARLEVETENDDLDEPDGTLTATVTGVVGHDLLTAAPTASVTVRDEDVEVSIESLTASVTEGQEARFEVTANEAPTTALTVSVELSGGDSFGVVSARSRKVVVPAGGTTAILPVPTEDDDEPDAPRTLRATIAAGVGYTPESGRASATARLQDDVAFGTPDVNADDAVNANDALILYYAYSLRSSLGTGR